MGYICFFVLCYNWAYKYTISHQESVFFSVIKYDGSWLIHNWCAWDREPNIIWCPSNEYYDLESYV